MKSCLFLTLVVTTLIFQQSLADIRSDFSIELKDYLRVVVAGNIVDAPAPGNAVLVAAENFV